jgi:plastocyanin
MRLGTLSAAVAAALLLQPFTFSGEKVAAAPTAATASIDVLDGPRTSPEYLTITAGDSVVFVNRGIIAHNPTALNGYFKTAPLKPGDSATVTFTDAGTFDFMCTLHTSQSGTIVVLPAPAPAVVDPSPAVTDPAPSAEPAAPPSAEPAAPPAAEQPPSDTAPAGPADPMAVNPADANLPAGDTSAG